MTGPEPVVLPITPPPNGQRHMLADAGPSSARPGSALVGGGLPARFGPVLRHRPVSSRCHSGQGAPAAQQDQ